jgi:hypothetical protein
VASHSVILKMYIYIKSTIFQTEGSVSNPCALHEGTGGKEHVTPYILCQSSLSLPGFFTPGRELPFPIE